jgi:hypothetical protein
MRDCSKVVKSWEQNCESIAHAAFSIPLAWFALLSVGQSIGLDFHLLIGRSLPSQPRTTARAARRNCCRGQQYHSETPLCFRGRSV